MWEMKIHLVEDNIVKVIIIKGNIIDIAFGIRLENGRPMINDGWR